MKLVDEIKDAILTAKVSSDAKERYMNLLEGGSLTREDDPVNHLCAYFFPYDIAAKKVFIVAHKKSGLWLSPGGHIELGEALFDTLTREIKEELGVRNPLPKESTPLLFTVTDIKRDTRACKVHFDMWYFLPTDGSDFKIDSDEFHETKWVSIDEARNLLVDENNLQAVEFIERNFFDKA